MPYKLQSKGGSHELCGTQAAGEIGEADQLTSTDTTAAIVYNEKWYWLVLFINGHFECHVIRAAFQCWSDIIPEAVRLSSLKQIFIFVYIVLSIAWCK